MVFYNYIIGGVVVQAKIPYKDVLAMTGLVDQVGLSELGYIEDIPVSIAPEISIEQKIKRQTDLINYKRDTLSKQGGYKVSVNGVDKWFHSDATSKIQQLGLVIAGAAVPPVFWKTMDGSFVTMSQVLAGKIFQAALMQDQSLFSTAEQHKAAMEASEDPETYDFNGNWPGTFTT